jgi:outer membrane lipase/esterase
MELKSKELSMWQQATHLLRWPIMAAASSVVLMGCGGSDGAETTPKKQFSSVQVFGDSLADSGTFGIKFTAPVQNESERLIFADLIAKTYGHTLCPRYRSNGTSFEKGAAGCTNSAVGGAKINDVLFSNTSVLSIEKQLKNAATAAYSSKDLILIDGGANDMADLVRAFLGSLSTDRATQVTSGAALNAMLFSKNIGLVNPGDPQAMALAVNSYVAKLAVDFKAEIKSNVLDRGGQHVVVLGIAALSYVPLVQASLAGVPEPTRTQFLEIFDGWVKTFNTTLTQSFAGDSRVIGVDLYSEMIRQIQNPAQYLITNITTPACPLATQNTLGATLAVFQTCPYDAAKTHYFFSDNFHPTPYLHRLTAQWISVNLAKAGWL